MSRTRSAAALALAPLVVGLLVLLPATGARAAVPTLESLTYLVGPYARDGWQDHPVAEVRLSAPAEGDTFVAVVSSDPSTLVVPGNGVTVPSGQTAAAVLVTTFQPGTVELTASLGGDELTATPSLRVGAVDEQPGIDEVSVDPTTVLPGDAATVTVVLDFLAPPGGAVVDLASSSGRVVLPASVTVPEDQVAATVEATTSAGPDTDVQLTASLGGSEGTTTLAIADPTALAEAIMETPGDLVSAEYTGATGARTVRTGALAGFPTHGDSYLVLSTGSAGAVADPDGELDVSTDWGTTAPHPSPGPQPPWGPVDPAVVRDLASLELEFFMPEGQCLRFQTRFLSEELDQVSDVGNDGFVVLRSAAPATNVALDPLDHRIQVASSQAPGAGTVYTAANAAGTTYDGGTPVMTHEVVTDPGFQSLRFVVYETGDGIADSTVLIDNLSFGPNCHAALGTELTAPAELAVGTETDFSVTVTNPTEETLPLDEISFELPDGLEYTAGSTIGVTSAEPVVQDGVLTWSDLGDLDPDDVALLSFYARPEHAVTDLLRVAVAAGPHQGADSATFEAFRVATTTTTTVVRTDRRIKVTGSVQPTHSGEHVVVTLLRRKDGEYRKVDRLRPVLTTASAYAAKFARPAKGRCRVVTRFPGDDDHRPSTATKDVRC